MSGERRAALSVEDKDKYQKIKQRLKIISGMKLNIENSPQNGRFNIQEGNLMIDVRASSLPGPNGEFLVFRLLNPKKAGYGLRDLGLSKKGEETFRRYLTSPNGMILVTGPTGSGKTTTLFSGIKEINDSSKKIITIEDPVEYQLDGVAQIQVKSDIGLTFAAGLRAILRQDPDIIMIGEIRDKETAEIAIRASLTGHLVFATLHTMSELDIAEKRLPQDGRIKIKIGDKEQDQTQRHPPAEMMARHQRPRIPPAPGLCQPVSYTHLTLPTIYSG
mgnify:CR=1 FL=1